jgi:hypothetical protein
VPLRRRQQRRQQLAVGGLELGPLGERVARLGDPVGEFVADPLEVAEPEQPRRRGDALDPVGDGEPREALGREPGQLALEPADLGAQLGAGETLVGADEHVSSQALSAQQLLHGLVASVDHGWSDAGRVG